MSLTFLVWCFLFGTIIPSRRNCVVLPTPIPLPHPCPADTRGTPLLAFFSCAQPDFSCPETSQPHGCRSDTLSLTRDPDNTTRHTLCRVHQQLSHLVLSLPSSWQWYTAQHKTAQQVLIFAFLTLSVCVFPFLFGCISVVPLMLYRALVGYCPLFVFVWKL